MSAKMCFVRGRTGGPISELKLHTLLCIIIIAVARTKMKTLNTQMLNDISDNDEHTGDARGGDEMLKSGLYLGDLLPVKM